MRRLSPPPRSASPGSPPRSLVLDRLRSRLRDSRCLDDGAPSDGRRLEDERCSPRSPRWRSWCLPEEWSRRDDGRPSLPPARPSPLGSPRRDDDVESLAEALEAERPLPSRRCRSEPFRSPPRPSPPFGSSPAFPSRAHPACGWPPPPAGAAVAAALFALGFIPLLSTAKPLSLASLTFASTSSRSGSSTPHQSRGWFAPSSWRTLIPSLGRGAAYAAPVTGSTSKKS